MSPSATAARLQPRTAWRRLTTQLVVGGRGAIVPLFRGALHRGVLELESLAQVAYPTRRVAGRLRAAQLQRLWEQSRPSRTVDSLHSYEYSRFSQNGEDGILAELFSRVGTTNRFFVEIGASDGSENCTRWLAEQGWHGLWIEADALAVEHARNVTGDQVSIVSGKAEPATVRDLLRDVPNQPDLVVIDIDGNDWWVMAAVLSVFRPRVLVVEYNAAFPPGAWWVQPYQPVGSWDGTFRHGASLCALAGLAKRFGLDLASCDSRGVNAFFVDGSLGLSTPADAEVRAYVGPWFSSRLGGHPRVPTRPGSSSPALSEDQASMVRLAVRRLGRTQHSAVELLSPVIVAVTVHNRSGSALRGTGERPLQFAARWRPLETSPSPWTQAARVPLDYEIPSGTMREVLIWQRAPEHCGNYSLDIVLVQENVRWLTNTTVSIDVAVVDSRV